MCQTAQQHRPVEEIAYLFVDFSNLWYSMRAEAARRGDPDRAVRAHAANLRSVLAAGRMVGDAVIVANRSVPESVLNHFRPGFRVELVESGSITGTEQGADELLQNAIYRTILRAPAAGVIVVATGDGAGWQEGRGFCEALSAARRQGFGVEVVPFERSLNRWLRGLANAVGVVVLLDRFYDSITFLEGLRPARSPSLTHRPTTVPAPWSAHDADAIPQRVEVRAA
jgi:hypothetical protein